MATTAAKAMSSESVGSTSPHRTFVSMDALRALKTRKGSIRRRNACLPRRGLWAALASAIFLALFWSIAGRVIAADEAAHSPR